MARLSFRCSDELAELVDVARGRVPRERWLRDAVLVAASAKGHSASDEWGRARAVEQALDGGVDHRASVPAEQPHKSPIQQASEIATKGGLVGEMFQEVADGLVDAQERGLADLGLKRASEVRSSARVHSPTCRCGICVPVKGKS